MVPSLEDTARFYARHRSAHDERAWDRFPALFAVDARYFDPFYGWMEGREAIGAFLTRSMAGLDDWTFPVSWDVVGPGRVVFQWSNRLPGRRPDGSAYEFPGLSALSYGADGLIVEQRDFYDRLATLQVLAAARTGAVGRTLGWAWDQVGGRVLDVAQRVVVGTERERR